MGLFDEVNDGEENNNSTEVKKDEVVLEFPEAVQIKTVVDGREEIIDTFVTDKKKGIIYTDKAKKKASNLKEAYPNRTFYVVEIINRIVGTY